MVKRTQSNVTLGKGWDCVLLNGPDGEVLIVRGPKGERIELGDQEVKTLRTLMNERN